MTVISLLITLIVYGLIFWLLWWALGKIALPEPFSKIATVVLVLAAVIVIIQILTGGVTPLHIAGLRV